MANQTRAARNEYQRAYREANRERRREQGRAYYEANREQELARNRAYREANSEKRAAYDRAYYEANRNRVLEQGRVYREANREAIVARQREYNHANAAYIRTQNGRASAALRARVAEAVTVAPWSRWTAAEDAALLAEPSNVVAAFALGRTHPSVCARRARLLRTA